MVNSQMAEAEDSPPAKPKRISRFMKSTTNVLEPHLQSEVPAEAATTYMSEVLSEHDDIIALTELEITVLVEHFSVMVFNPGETVLQAGEEGTWFGLLLSGTLDCTVGDQQVEGTFRFPPAACHLLPPARYLQPATCHPPPFTLHPPPASSIPSPTQPPTATCPPPARCPPPRPAACLPAHLSRACSPAYLSTRLPACFLASLLPPHLTTFPPARLPT